MTLMCIKTVKYVLSKGGKVIYLDLFRSVNEIDEFRALSPDISRDIFDYPEGFVAPEIYSYGFHGQLFEYDY